MIKKILCITALAVSNNLVFAAQDFAECRQFFANGQVPAIDHKHELNTRALCFSNFAVLHSGKSHTPLYVAEKLNRDPVEDLQTYWIFT